MIDTLINSGIFWIFQCNPKKYNIKEALLDKMVIDCFHWKVKQHSGEIDKGHIGLIWCSGISAGIYAITELISKPGEYIESNDEKKYWIDDSDEKGSQKRVKMKLIENFCLNPIFKETISKTEGLQNLSILKMPRGTNFGVTNNERILLTKLIKNVRQQRV